MRQRMTIGLTALIALALAAPAGMVAASTDDEGWTFEVVDDSGLPVPDTTVIVSPMWNLEELWRAKGKTKPHPFKANANGVARGLLKLSAEEQDAVDSNGGWLNITVTTLDANGMPAGSMGISRYLGNQPGQAAQQEDAAKPGRSVRVTASQTMADSARRAAGSDPATQTAAASQAQAAVTAQFTNCTNYRWVPYTYSWTYTRIGDLHSAADTVLVKHQYGTTSDASMDIGFKTGDGPWTISGMAHSGESLGNLYDKHAASNFHWGIWAPFNYVLLFFYADCFEGTMYMGHSSVEQDGYHTQENLTNNYVLSYPARDLTHPEWALRSGPGTGYTRQVNKFRKYTAAFCMWGFCGGATSGASVFSLQTWSFGSGQTNHYLYGIGAPYTTAGVIYASNN